MTGKPENQKFLLLNLPEKVRELNRMLLEVDWQNADFDSDSFNNGISLDTCDFNNEQRRLLKAILENIPEWKRLLRCKQHITHDHCLDIHTLSVIKKTREFELYKKASEYEKLLLLYSALLHDIEKIENEVDPEHPVRGAKKSSAILYRLGFSEDFINCVYLLIKYHQILGLLVSDKICLADKEIIETFKNARLLELQAVLSIADIKSVKKKELFLPENMEKRLEQIVCRIKNQLPGNQL